MNDFELEKDRYYEKLLALQYEASSFISHQLTKGELREEFIRRILIDEFVHLKDYLERGLIQQNTNEHRQHDLVWIKPGARSGMRMFDINDCKMVIEVKSKVQSSEIEEFNDLSRHYKRCCNIESKPKTGLFCYSTSVSKETILGRFGYHFIPDEDGNYDVNEDEPIYAFDNDLFRSIDFIYCLNVDDEFVNPYFIINNMMVGNDMSRARSLFHKGTVITYLFHEFRF